MDRSRESVLGVHWREGWWGRATMKAHPALHHPPSPLRLGDTMRLWCLFLKDPDVAEDGFGAVLGVAAYEEADHAGGEGGVGVGGDDELAVDVEAEVGAAGDDEESVGGVVAALDGAGGGPVDEGEPVEGVAAGGAHEAILALAVDFENVEVARGGAETEDQAVDVAVEQACLRGDDHVGVLLLAGIAPRDFTRDG